MRDPHLPKAAPKHASLKLALVWGTLSAIASVLALPYILAISPLQPFPMPVWQLALITCVQSWVSMTLLAWAGIAAGRRVGLGSPWVGTRLGLTSKRPPKPNWRLAIGLGVAVGLAVIALDAGVFAPWMPDPIRDTAQLTPAAWKGLLASFYGGIAEEVMLRLGVMSVLVWMLHTAASKLSPKTPRRPGRGLVWGVIVAAALLFGLGHLPAASGVWELTPLVVTRVVLLNALVGVPMGWLYWRKGLEHAIAAHFSADIVLHVAVPLVTAAFGIGGA